MSDKYTIHRYAAYFKGWCQAFGEHEAHLTKDESITWLYGDNQIGLILPHALSKQLQREMLGKKHHKHPVLTLSRDCVCVGDFHHNFSDPHDLTGLGKLIETLRKGSELHLFLTYHFMYQRGTRIITFSTEQPWPLIYKAIEPLQIQLV
jgi:hypothetical protein